MGRFINADVLTSTGQGFIGYNMFAYCINNPVCYVDFSGGLPAPIVPLWDYYFIHRRVQEEIVNDYGYAMEVYVIKTDGRKGRLDLYDAETNTFYEVKHIIAAGLSSTQDQIKEYSTSTITDKRFADYLISGSPSAGVNIHIGGEFDYSIYHVTYQFDPGGIISYSIHYKDEALVATAAVGLALSMGGGKVTSHSKQSIINPANSVY